MGKVTPWREGPLDITKAWGLQQSGYFNHIGKVSLGQNWAPMHSWFLMATLGRSVRRLWLAGDNSGLLPVAFGNGRLSIWFCDSNAFRMDHGQRIFGPNWSPRPNASGGGGKVSQVIESGSVKLLRKHEAQTQSPANLLTLRMTACWCPFKAQQKQTHVKGKKPGRASNIPHLGLNHRISL